VSGGEIRVARDPREAINDLRTNIARVFLGPSRAVDRILIALLARGHILIEDVPGVGKTVLAHALARSIDCTFSRIQLTPDLLPTDILGVSVYQRATETFRFEPGPIFANIVLADEINRTPPRTQTALLEAMSEGSVTIDGKTRQLGPPFMVVATQNPYEFEGTYTLPENQLDRFLMRISLGYPDAADEARVLDQRPADHALPSLTPVMSREDVVALQKRTDDVKVDRSLLEYVIAIANATRKADELWLGLSPRGSLALAQAARATAAIAGRDYVIPDDIYHNVIAVTAHRVVARAALTNGHGTASTADSERIVARILETVPSPA
jgi:MoxR-like ATPase